MRKEEKRITTHECSHIVEIRCDLCGKLRDNPNARSWSGGWYDIDETEVFIKHSRGVSYPEGGDSTDIYYDICPQCFTNTIVPFLESKGAKPTIKTIDF